MDNLFDTIAFPLYIFFYPGFLTGADAGRNLRLFIYENVTPFFIGLLQKNNNSGRDDVKFHEQFSCATALMKNRLHVRFYITKFNKRKAVRKVY